MWILFVLLLVVAGAFIARAVRAGWAGSSLSPNDLPAPPANTNNLTNWLAFENMQRAQDPVSTTDTSSNDAPAFFDDSNSGNAPEPDHSDPGGASSYASDPSASGYDPGNGGSDGGGSGGGGGNAF